MCNEKKQLKKQDTDDIQKSIHKATQDLSVHDLVVVTCEHCANKAVEDGAVLLIVNSAGSVDVVCTYKCKFTRCQLGQQTIVKSM